MADEEVVSYSNAMQLDPEDRSSPPAAPHLHREAILATALAAGYANLAFGVLDQPRAFASITSLFPPLALGVAAMLGVAILAVVIGGRGLRACGISTGAALSAIGVFVVLAAGLAPLVEALGRELTDANRLVLWTVVGAAFLCAAAFTGAIAGRFGSDERTRRAGLLLSFGGAFVAIEAMFVLWIVTFPLGSSSVLVRGGIVGAWVLAVIAALWILGRIDLSLRPLPFLFIALVLTLASPLLSFATNDAALPARADLPAGRPQHVILITVDTLRSDMIGAEHDGAAPTPAIDALFADSTVFTGARAAAPWTKPSVASILTGLSPLVHGATHRTRILPPEVHTLAEHMQDAGYTTIGVGLNVHLEPVFRFQQGFDEYWFPARNDWGVSLGARILEYLDGHRWPEIFPTTTAIADRAIERLASRTDEPVFLWIHILDPHWPYHPPEGFVPPRSPDSRIADRWGEHDTVTNVQAGSTKLGAADQERVRDLYRGEIAYVDTNLARLIDFLKSAGIYDDALIAFTSDHGEEFWEHGGFEHGHTMFDEVLRVPLAFKLPGGTLKTRFDAIVTNESLTPTLLDLVGQPNTKNAFTSPSLAPYLDPTLEEPAPAPIFSAATYYHGEKRAVIFDGLKAVLELDTGRMQLYELATDPQEMSSLTAARPEDVKRAAELLGARVEAANALREAIGLDEDQTVDAGDAIKRALDKLGYLGDDH